MHPNLSRRVFDLTQQQHGVVLRSQLHDAGLPPRTTHRRIKEGLWTPVGRNVLILSGTEDSLATRSRVVGLQVPNAILTGPSAAVLLGGALWNNVRFGDQPWLISRPRAASAKYLSHPGFRVQILGPWRVASVADAVVDFIRFLPPDQARTLAYRAVQRRVLSVQELLFQADRLSRFAGIEQLRTVVADVARGARSEGERNLMSLLDADRIVGWSPNVRVTVNGRAYVLDIAFRDFRLALEVDGYAFHSDLKSFREDRRRQNALMNAGWLVLRYTWQDITAYPKRTVTEIKDAIETLKR